MEGQLVGLEVTSGRLRWSVPIKLPGFEGPATARNRVFAGGVDGLLYALDAKIGREKWRAKLAAASSTSVSPSATDIYVGSADESMYRVDARRGKVLASIRLSADLKPSSLPVRIADSLIVLLTDQAADYRSLISVEPSLSRVHWKKGYGRTVMVARGQRTCQSIEGVGDTLLVGTRTGTLYALHAPRSCNVK